MNKQQARQIIRDTFESSFDKVRFTNFIRNLLNSIDESKAFHARSYVKETFSNVIKTYERIGTYNSPDEKAIDIIIVYLQKGYSLDYARVTQRNFAGRYLIDRGVKDAGLFAFVAPDAADWRFSLVKMDYKFEKAKSGRMKVKEELTPARRWSFLVGANEKSHTAQSRLVKILANDEQAPTLKEIEQAFDIETVTKEFFLNYRELFLRTKEELDRVVKNYPKIKTDFEAKGVDTVNFAKKLLGQIIFLYFLQKKGWFGVGRDDDWGTGSKHFLRELFDKKHGDYRNFFNDILEPLFYEALRRDRSDDDGYYKLFNCKIPFLNGGLFDPIGSDRGYSWVDTDILLPNKLFSNTNKTIEGDTGDGILDIFDRYNFTVKEDEPLEKEVAIDPELLGKSYEKFNAIRPDNYDEFRKVLKSGNKGEENKFNKKFGVYYTPREIVHYMCQQSLINYLANEVVGMDFNPPIKKEDIETLIHTGEQVSENEARVLSRGKETKTYSHKLPESIRSNAALIDQKLSDITVCDPAVGSGAFPVGMLSEIVRARNVLSTFLQDNTRTPYEFKRRCIEHSLYGVDIDPGAVEIAKLRLWLSLVVDEEDIKNIKPLPNLDYRIMQGNSLISEFMGINFDTEKEENSGNLMFKDETNELIEHFQQKKDEFLNESNVTRKSKLKEEIDVLLIEIFETKLKTQKADYFNRLKEIETMHSSWPTQEQRDDNIKRDKEELYNKSGFNLESVESQLKEFTSGRKIKPFFLWNLYFSEVFHNKACPDRSRRGGFDVVIANPPYVSYYSKSQNTAYKVQDELYSLKQHYDYIVDKKKKGRYNSMNFFIEKGLKLLSSNSVLMYIVDYSIHEKAALNIRNFIVENYSIYEIIYNLSAFENVTSDQSILSIINKKPNNNSFRWKMKFCTHPHIYNQNTITKFNGYSLYFSPYDYILKKIEQNNNKLIDYIDYTIGIQIGGKNLKYKGKSIKSLFIFKFKEKGYNLINNIVDIQKYGKPIINGYINFDVSLGTKVNKAVRDANIALPNNEPFIKSPKIIMRQSASVLTATLADKDRVCEHKFFVFKQKFKSILDLKYIIAITNSSLLTFYALERNIIKHGEKKQPQIRIKEVVQLPVIEINNEKQKPFVDIVDRILSFTHSDNYLHNQQKQTIVKKLEKQIDHLVYELYNLTPKEIKIVEDEKSVPHKNLKLISGLGNLPIQ